MPHLFIDTKILFYAHDLDSSPKREIALTLISNLISGPYPPAISVQVLNELYVNIAKKVSTTIAWKVCEQYFDWEIISLSLETFSQAVSIRDRYKISFWDGAIVAAAKRARAEVIVSEDLAHGQKYEDIEVINPFLANSLQKLISL